MLKEADKSLFFFLNGLGHPQLDQFMLWMSDKYIWIPLYVLILVLIWYRYGFKAWYPLLFMIAAIGLSDFITSGLMKPFFERLRPCRNQDLLPYLVNIGKCGGKYGFASSHAANTAALSVFTWLLLRNTFAVLLLIWALLVGYSRIYLGVHYPGDVIVGIMIGAMLALLLFYLQTYLSKRIYGSRLI